MYLAEYVSGGVDPAATGLHYAGQIDDGGFSMTPIREYAPIEGEEEFEASGDIKTKEGTTIKCVLQEAPIEMVALLLGSDVTITNPSGASVLAATNVAADTSGAPDIKQLGYGGMPGDDNARYYQVLLRCPNESFPVGSDPFFRFMSFMGYYQVWAGLIVPAGDWVLQKKGVAKMPIEIRARWDWTVTPAVTATTSTGRIWKRTIVTSNS
jgi:hypothetical protein